MFISKKEKEKMLADIEHLQSIVNGLSASLFQLEVWVPVGKEKLDQNSNAYKWVKAFENLEPKKRGRPVGSKNKEKK